MIFLLVAIAILIVVVAGWWRYRSGRKKFPSQFKEWVAGGFVAEKGPPDSETVQAFAAWLSGLPAEEFEAFGRPVASFCADLDFELAWLLNTQLDNDPALKQTLGELVLLYSLAHWKAIQTQDDIKVFNTFRAWQAGKKRRALTQKLFSRLVEKSLISTPPPDLVLAPKKEIQTYVVQAICQFAEQDRQMLMATLKEVIFTPDKPPVPSAVSTKETPSASDSPPTSPPKKSREDKAKEETPPAELASPSATVKKMSQKTKAHRIPLFSGDLFKRRMAILIALVTVLIGIVAVLEAEMGGQVAQATLLSQQYAIQAIGVKASGEMETGYAWFDAYHRWLEWDTLTLFAELNDDPAAARRYQAVRDRASELSPLLVAPYFAPETDDFPNIKAFEADTYLVENTILTERFAAATALAGALGAKQSAYVTQLLLLAVSLFLYGLSTTIVGRMKWLFVTVGSIMVGLTLLWMTIITFTTPVEVFPDEAITAYANGVGLAHQDENVAAIKSFEKALASAPDYANAYYARARVYFDLGHLSQAVADYVAAIEAGREDITAPWNLGWTYYVLGQPDEAITATQTALAIDESQVALHFNLGLAQLARGEDIPAAKATYAGGIDLARQQVVDAQAAGEEAPSSLWWYLNTAAIDLDNFVNCLSGQVCWDAPPYDTLDHSDAVQTAAAELRTELKNVTVALEHLGQLPEESVTATIGEIAVETVVPEPEEVLVEADDAGQGSGGRLRGGQALEQEGEAVDVSLIRASPDEASQVFILFDYEGLADGQLFTMKVYQDGWEATDLRLVESWERGEAGEVRLPLTPGSQFALPPAEYRVEIYVDAHLVQESLFTIADEQELKVE